LSLSSEKLDSNFAFHTFLAFWLVLSSHKHTHIQLVPLHFGPGQLRRSNKKEKKGKQGGNKNAKVLEEGSGAKPKRPRTAGLYELNSVYPIHSLKAPGFNP
jgi:hypothetical protein